MNPTRSLSITPIADPAWSATDAGSDTVADVIRQVVAAHGVSTRRRVVASVADMLGAQTREDLVAIRRTLDTLDAAGDVLVGPMGRVAVAPLFVARVSSGVALLIGGVASREAREAFLTLVIEEGAPRRIASGGDALGPWVERSGGREISVSDWAGLDATPAADAAWLSALTARLDLASQVGTLERLDAVAPGDRQQYAPATESRPQGFGWAGAVAPASPSLWRWRDGRADWSFGWSTGSAWPGALRLSGDEAARTRFALDRAGGGSLPVAVSSTDAVVTLRMDGRLPRAEYRYLVAHANSVAREGWSTVFVLPIGSWEAAAGVLRDRLGLPV